MNLLLKIILLLIVVGAGFEAMPFIVALAAKIDQLPHLPEGSAIFAQFGFALRAATFVWLAASAAGTGWLFVRRRQWRVWLLLAPLYAPAVYTALVIVYFNFVPIS